MENSLSDSLTQQPQKGNDPAFLREEYRYKANGEEITELSELQDEMVYEIKCRQCKMSIRSQGQNIGALLKRMNERGCIGCGNIEFALYMVDMSNY